jgi:predicted nucleic acid-binding protein
MKPVTAVGRVRISTTVARLVDTNVIVYRFDPRFPEKQSIAVRLLRQGIEQGDMRLAHQSIVEFVAAVIRPLGKGRKASPLLSRHDAVREAEELLAQFPVLFPTDDVLRTALRGMGAYQLSWFDAHLWAYAECNGIEELVSEDFQHGRVYGRVRVRNPFV